MKKNIIPILLILFFLSLPKIVFADTQTSVDGSTLITYQTQCPPGNHRGTHGIIIPDNLTNPAKIYLHFHGNNDPDVNTICKGHKLCADASALKVVILIPTTKRSEEKNLTPEELTFYLNEAYDKLNFYLRPKNISFSRNIDTVSGHSGGGGSINAFLTTEKANRVLLFDACYSTWCNTILNKKPDNVFFYTRPSEDPKDPINMSEPIKDKFFRRLIVNLSHPQVLFNCYLDHITNDHCNTPVVDQNINLNAGSGQNQDFEEMSSLYTRSGQSFFQRVAPQVRPGSSLKPIGSECTDNDECDSGDCEYSDIEKAGGNNLAYCDCSNDDYCGIAYGVSNGEEWDCKDGSSASRDLDYCVSTKGRVEFPLESNKSNFWDYILDVEAALKKGGVGMLQKPDVRIRIPGLNFSDVSIDNSGNQSGLTLNTPFLAEYVASIYRYVIVIAGIIATIMIIVGGLQWIMSGGEGSMVEGAKKKIGGAIVGLLLAVGSYTILYTVNPDLVKFKNLGVTLIAGENYSNEEESAEIAEENHVELDENRQQLSGITMAVFPINSNPCFPLQARLAKATYTDLGDIRTPTERLKTFRCHAGNDLIIVQGTTADVRAMDNGEVLQISPKFASCEDEFNKVKGVRINLNQTATKRTGLKGPYYQAAGVYIYHENLGLTINYGEIDLGTLKVSKGQIVKKGEILGQIGFCDMLHVEMYQGRHIPTNTYWSIPDRLIIGFDPRTNKSKFKDLCLTNPEWYQQSDTQRLNPGQALKGIAGNVCQ